MNIHSDNAVHKLSKDSGKKPGRLIRPLLKSYYFPPDLFQELNNLWSRVQLLYKFFLNLN